MTRDGQSSIPSGTRVRILLSRASSVSFLEGWARILSAYGDEPNLYLVLFENEALPQVRIVRPEWQVDPAQAVLQFVEPSNATPDPEHPRILPFAMLRLLRLNSSET